jgi:ribonuclease BN (tRNA processing enzyme)
VIWPDFTRLPDVAHPALQFVPLVLGQVVEAAGHHIEVLPAQHTVPAVGYAVLGQSAGAGAWVYTGDTGPNAALWDRLATLKVAALVIETAFRDDEHAVATVSQHLCPARLQTELMQLAQPTDVYITHIKPGEVQTVMAEIAAQRTVHRILPLLSGQVLQLG